MNSDRLWKTIVFALAIASVSGDVDARAQDSEQAPGRHGGRRAEVLRRLDANGDGILQPDEIPDRAKPLFRRAAERSGLKPDQPISLDRLIGEPREEQGASDQPGRQAPADKLTSDRSTGGKDADRSGAEMPSGQPRSIRGFGEEARLPPVPGFDVPLETGESETHANNRRPAGAASGSARTSPSHQTDDSRKKSPAKKAIATRTRYYARSLIKKNDKNKDGMLQADEFQGVRGGVKNADRNGDGNISLDELATNLSDESTGSGRSRQFGQNRPTSKMDKTVSQPDRARDSVGGVPDNTVRKREKQFDRQRWFDEHDRDHDGQVAMSEFASDWTPSKVAEFERLDPNGDGFITRQETE